METPTRSPKFFGIQLPHRKPSQAALNPVAGAAEIPEQTGPAQSWRDRLPNGWPYWLAGVGIAGVIVFALRPSPIAVDLGTVEEGSLQVTVDAEGKTRVRERYLIAAPVAGRLSRIELESGDSIQANGVVAQLDPLSFNSEVQAAEARLEELQAQIAGVETQRPKNAALAQTEADINAAIARQRQAEANAQEAQASLTQAQRDRDRAQGLQTAGAISRQAREDAELTANSRQQTLAAAQRQVEAERANVAAARNALALLQAEQQDPDYLVDVYRAQMASVEAELLRLTDDAQRTTVTAPAGGTVLQVMEKSARFVQAGEPLLEVGNASQLELVIDILSTDAIRIEPGASIQIDQWGGDQPLSAQVRYVEPSAFTEVSALGVEEQRVNVIADFIDPPLALGDGYRVEAQIVIWSAEAVPTVPISALFRCNPETWCTFVAQDGKAQQREIVISQRNDLAAAVASGLSPGEQVILHPSEEIKEGQRVRDRE